jgi:hypothetical protein
MNMDQQNNDSWAVAELMGHVTIAGRITKPGEYGGLWQIDIPEGDSFRTEFFGSQAVYRIRIVSEEIARAYARPGHEIIAYDAPIITREEHVAAMEKAREVNTRLREQLQDAERKLMALPAVTSGGDELLHVVETWEDEPAGDRDDLLDEDDDDE